MGKSWKRKKRRKKIIVHGKVKIKQREHVAWVIFR